MSLKTMLGMDPPGTKPKENYNMMLAREWNNPYAKLTRGQRVKGAILYSIEDQTVNRLGVLGTLIQNKREGQGMGLRETLAHSALGELSQSLGIAGRLGLQLTDVQAIQNTIQLNEHKRKSGEETSVEDLAEEIDNINNRLIIQDKKLEDQSNKYNAQLQRISSLLDERRKISIAEIEKSNDKMKKELKRAHDRISDLNQRFDKLNYIQPDNDEDDDSGMQEDGTVKPKKGGTLATFLRKRVEKAVGAKIASAVGRIPMKGVSQAVASAGIGQMLKTGTARVLPYAAVGVGSAAALMLSGKVGSALASTAKDAWQKSQTDSETGEPTPYSPTGAAYHILKWMRGRKTATEPSPEVKAEAKPAELQQERGQFIKAKKYRIESSTDFVMKSVAEMIFESNRSIRIRAPKLILECAEIKSDNWSPSQQQTIQTPQRSTDDKQKITNPTHDAESSNTYRNRLSQYTPFSTDGPYSAQERVLGRRTGGSVGSYSEGSPSQNSRTSKSDTPMYLPPKEALPDALRVPDDKSPNQALPGQFRMPDQAPLTQAPANGIDRAGFKPQLENQEIKDRLFALTLSEVPSSNPASQRALMETIFNRNQAHGQGSLMDTMNSRYYEPMQNGAYERNLQRLRNNPQLRAQLEERLSEVMAGSNDSNFGTHNSSAGVAASAHRTQTVTATIGGETFSRKDQSQWASLHGAGTTNKESSWFRSASQPRTESREITSQDPYAGQRVRRESSAGVRQDASPITTPDQMQRAYHITGDVNLPAVGEYGQASYRGGTGGAGNGSMPYGVHSISGPRASGPIITRSIGLQTVYHVGSESSGYQRMVDPKLGVARSEIQIHSARDAQRLLSNGCLAIDPKQHKQFVEHMNALIKEHGSVQLEFLPSPKGQPHQFNIRPASAQTSSASAMTVNQAISNFRSTGDVNPAVVSRDDVQRIPMGDMTTEQRQTKIRELTQSGYGNIRMTVDGDNNPIIFAKRGDPDFRPRSPNAPVMGPTWYPPDVAKMINEQRGLSIEGARQNSVPLSQAALAELQTPNIKPEDIKPSPIQIPQQNPNSQVITKPYDHPAAPGPDESVAEIRQPTYNPEERPASVSDDGAGHNKQARSLDE